MNKEYVKENYKNLYLKYKSKYLKLKKYEMSDNKSIIKYDKIFKDL